MLFCRFISTAGCVPSAEHCTCIPSCYANVSSGTSLHRHTTCIFWGNYCIYKSYDDTVNTPVTVLSGFKPLSVHLCVCRYTSPDMCFHLRCLVRCLRCPLPTLVLRCLCPCSHLWLLGQWARMSPWLTIPWARCTRLVQQWWWKAALILVLASQQAAACPSQWVSTKLGDLKETHRWQLGFCWNALSSHPMSVYVCACFSPSLAPTSWASPQCSSAGCHAGCQRCNVTAQE